MSFDIIDGFTKPKRKKIPSSDKNEVIERQGSRCNMCNDTLNPKATHIDHILPKSEGGTDNIDNLQALCSNCHSIKTHNDTQRNVQKQGIKQESFDPIWGENRLRTGKKFKVI